MNISEMVTDDFVLAFQSDADCWGVFARLCVQFFPDGLPEGVDPTDERVLAIIERIRRVQGLAA